MSQDPNLMNLTDALAQTAFVDLGIAARCVKRRDKRGRLWYLIDVRSHQFLVRQDKSGFIKVSHQFASQWEDWRPQTVEDAARETAILSTPGGRRFRNTVLGLVMGPVPKGLKAPDRVPEELHLETDGA